MIRFYAENQADPVTLTTADAVPTGAAWHQVGAANPLGDEGYVDIEVNDGTGFRVYGRIDLTDAQRVPFVMVLDAEAVRFTPDRAVTLCYKAQPAGLL